MPPLLELRRVGVTLGRFNLSSVSLSLEAGDYLVLLGPSGCGKSTLLRCIVGAHEIGAARLFLDGRDIGILPPQARQVGYVSQAADLFPHLTVAENIRFGLRYVSVEEPEKQARFVRIARLTGVAHLLGRATVNLSGGEAKRVALARSLVIAPRLLLLDEPLSVLDHNARAGMVDTLRAVHRELGTATIHVTHDRDEARRLGGHCAVMNEGRIEQIGGMDDLVRRPANPFVAGFMGDGRDGA